MVSGIVAARLYNSAFLLTVRSMLVHAIRMPSGNVRHFIHRLADTKVVSPCLSLERIKKASRRTTHLIGHVLDS